MKGCFQAVYRPFTLKMALIHIYRLSEFYDIGLFALEKVDIGIKKSDFLIKTNNIQAS